MEEETTAEKMVGKRVGKSVEKSVEKRKFEQEFLNSADVFEVTAHLMLQIMRKPKPFSEYYTDFVFNVDKDAFQKRLDKNKVPSTLCGMIQRINSINKELKEERCV